MADEQRSVAPQIEHGRGYAQRKGWIVADEHVFIDDGVSGAEFSNRPGFVRLMNALKPQPAFQVLIMSEESRLGREAIETAYTLKQLVTAGVRVFSISRIANARSTVRMTMLLSLAAFADELEREGVDAVEKAVKRKTKIFARVNGPDGVTPRRSPHGRQDRSKRQSLSRAFWMPTCCSRNCTSTQGSRLAWIGHTGRTDCSSEPSS